jgi:hypothetical protein
MAKAAAKKAKAVEKPVEVKVKGGKAGKGSKVPKTIAGVKIPKSLRESASSIISLIETPLGRQILSDVLIAAAGALMANKSITGAAGSAVDRVEKAGAAAAGRTRDAAQAVTDVVTEAARQILPSSMTAGLRDDRPDEDEDVPAKARGKSEPRTTVDAARRQPAPRVAKPSAKPGRGRGV